MARTAISRSTKEAVLLEAGYRCANPVCRHVLTLELHHIQWVKDGGGNKPENLVPLCPNCHALHTHGHLPGGAIGVWKAVLVSLMNPHRASADVLLTLDADERRFAAESDQTRSAPKVSIHRRQPGFLSGLMAGELVEVTHHYTGKTVWGQGIPSFEVRLTPRGRALVEAWKAGSVEQLRSALGYTVQGS